MDLTTDNEPEVTEYTLADLQLATQTAFASEFSFYLKTHGFHWNVEGSDFQQFHQLFETIYSEVYDSIDAFAENIRKLGAYAPAGLVKLAGLSLLMDESSVPSARAMAAELLADSEKMCEVFKTAFDIADDLDENGLSNFFADRQDAHRKHSWMLRSILK